MTFDHSAHLPVEEAVGEGDEEPLEWQQNIPDDDENCCEGWARVVWPHDGDQVCDAEQGDDDDEGLGGPQVDVLGVVLGLVAPQFGDDNLQISFCISASSKSVAAIICWHSERKSLQGTNKEQRQRRTDDSTHSHNPDAEDKVADEEETDGEGVGPQLQRLGLLRVGDEGAAELTGQHHLRLVVTVDQEGPDQGQHQWGSCTEQSQW